MPELDPRRLIAASAIAVLRENASGSVMPHIPILEPDAASLEVRAVYEEFYHRMSFPAPPNFITIQGHSSAAARGIWELLKNVLLGGQVPRWKKELIIVAISHERDCRYCAAAHAACCTMLGVNAIYMVRDVRKIPDVALRDAILFAMKAARDPQSLRESDYDTLRTHGFTHSDMVELISVAGLAVYLNIIADATGVETDEMIRGTP
ncbi:MAG TPA: carboxymuconolactone decarboxylase family protein [Acetobacteraceae bacterium]